MVIRKTHATWVAATLAMAGVSSLQADPSQTSLLSPVFALSGRSGDPEHFVNPFELAVTETAATQGRIVSDEFASADPEVPSGQSLPNHLDPVGDGLTQGPQMTVDEFASDSGDSAETEFHDFQDTLIRSEQDSRVQTFVGEGGERLPGSWAVPPGGEVPGGYPGYRREVPSVDYTGNSGVSYFPPPSIDSHYRGASAYPPSGVYHPGGPYAYQYDGMVPLDGPMYQEDTSFEFQGGIPLFTRQFNPEDAHLKVGPFYFQALWVESGVLYSDYHGPAVFAPGEEDGWLGYSSFGFRMAARLTPSLYLAADGEVIYVYGTNELGFRSGLNGGPFASLVYETEWGSWEIRAFAEFGTGSFYDAFGSDAYDRAGRYSFGFYGRYDEGLLYDPYLYTRVGVEASTLTTPDWRLTLTADHTDYWYLGDDTSEDHHAREHFGALYGAEPNTVPFTPWFSYDLYSDDSFDTAYHTIYAGGSGRLSENVYFDGRAGYFWTSNDFSNNEHWLWNIGLRHRINERTSHGIRVGQDFFMNDFSIDSTISTFFQYYIDHQVSDRLSVHAFAQWSTDEFLSGPYVGGEYESEIYGVRANYRITDRLTFDTGYLIEERRNNDTGVQFERSIYDANLNARIGLRSTGYLRYQHEDTDFYYEDVYMAGIRRYF